MIRKPGAGSPRDISGTRLRGDHAQIKAVGRDDDSEKSHSALELESSSNCFVLFSKGVCHV
jgi:hypothetical protein